MTYKEFKELREKENAIIQEVRALLACAYAGRWIGRELGWA